MIDDLDQLRGTSTAKAGALMQLVRSEGKASLALGVLERMPVIGETVKFLMYDVPAMEPEALDALLDRVIDCVRCLKSDDPETLNSADATDGD